jgi:hypothetical protein
VRAGDSQRFGLDLKLEGSEIIEVASAAVLGSEVDLSVYSSTPIRGKPCISYQDYHAHLLLRAIARHLRRRLRISLPNRDRMIMGVIETLLDGTPAYVIRRDITSFYESIPVEPLREKLVFDTASSALVRNYLRKYFETHCPNAESCGLPRGVGLSALLAEISMRGFDAAVKTIPGVFKYYRFSDDIIIFSTTNPDSFLTQLDAALPETMSFNPDKSDEYFLPGKSSSPNDEIDFEYLGYSFSALQQKERADSRVVNVRVSRKKINKIKSKIILSLKSHAKTGDDLLLRDRLKFLSGNYRVKRSNVTSHKKVSYVHSGIFYNYQMCGTYFVRSGLRHELPYDCVELKALDGFYNSILSSCIKNMSNKITPSQMVRLRRDICT